MRARYYLLLLLSYSMSAIDNVSQHPAVFVFVHGGFMGGWLWEKVKKILEAQGHAIYTPTLTGLGEHAHLNHATVGLDTHSADIQSLIESHDLKNIILIGHSYAGLVITAVASKLHQRIKSLIYLDALVPDNGDSLMTLVDERRACLFRQQAEKKGFGWRVPPFKIPKNGFKEPADVAWCNSRLTPQSIRSFEQEGNFDSDLYTKIPTVFIHCSNNRDTAMQRMKLKAQEKGFTYFEMDSNHFPMIDNPEKLSDLILKIL